jgi:hypothetical protein
LRTDIGDERPSVAHWRAGLTLREGRWWCAQKPPAQTEVFSHFLENEKSYGHDSSKRGTPSGADSLCQTCTRGHVIKGFSVTEKEVFCRFFYIEREILFPVRECTFYEDKRLATLGAMEEIAWFLTTRKAGRTVGYVSA